MQRRDFLKYMGVATLGAGAVAAGVTGYLDGANPMTHTGWEGANRTPETLFNRGPFEVSQVPNPRVEPIRPIRFMSFDNSHSRRLSLQAAYGIENPEDNSVEFQQLLEGLGVTPENVDNYTFDTPPGVPGFQLPEDLRQYYQDFFELQGFNHFVEDLRNFVTINPFVEQSRAEQEFDFHVTRAFFGAFGTHAGRHENWEGRAEQADFAGVNPTQYEVADPAALTRMIKQIGMIFGASIVRIARLDPRWAYSDSVGGRGYDRRESMETLPEHWVYGIVMCTPMEWVSSQGSPAWGASATGYGQLGVATARMTEFVKALGYPARDSGPHTGGFEFVMPAVLVGCGVGELGRLGVCISPELGPNLRPGMVITNMPLVADPPIDAGIRRFCDRCMICAEHCPSASISFNPEAQISGRDYVGWQINTATCHNFVRSAPAGYCFVCVTKCPFSQKQNWLHRVARDVAVRDVTGLSAHALAWMDRAFYGTHDPQAMHYEMGSRQYNAVGPQPWWLDTSSFFQES